MTLITRTTFLAAAAILAGCASQPPAGPPGKHLVYLDSRGSPVRQFDYPDDSFCKRVEKLAGRSARCQADNVSARLPAQATLRYNPPGVLIHGHYSDMGRCQTDTKALPPGVQLVEGCKAK